MQSTAPARLWRGQIDYSQHSQAKRHSGAPASGFNTAGKAGAVGRDSFQTTTRQPRFGQAVNTISTTSEIELKGLVSHPHDFEKIKKYFNQSGYYTFSAADGGYYTAYFDTPDNNLLRKDYYLRIRKSTENNTYNDLSIKTPVLGKSNLYRQEYEAAIPEIRMDLAAVRKLGSDANSVVNQVLALCNGDPLKNLKEKVYSKCQRSLFRVLLYVKQTSNGRIIITPAKQSKAQIEPAGSKRAVYEAALDQITFFAGGPNGNSEQKIGEDFEIEWELKQSSANERDEQPVSSSSNLTEEEALAGLKYLQSETNKATPKMAINWEGQSKQNRGFNYLNEHSSPPPLPPFLTAFGQPVPLITFGQTRIKNGL